MEYSLARGAVSIFKGFLYTKCVNFRGVTAVFSPKRSFCFYLLRCVNEW